MLTLTIDEVKKLNKATFDAFLESGKYALSYNQACEQFGRIQIDTLIANKLLENTSELMGRKKYLISDIVAAQQLWRKL